MPLSPLSAAHPKPIRVLEWRVRARLSRPRASTSHLVPEEPSPASLRSPRWVHRDLPRSAPPDSWRSLRCARVPPMDDRDELRPCQSVHYVPERLFTISPVATHRGRGGTIALAIVGEGNAASAMARTMP